MAKSRFKTKLSRAQKRKDILVFLSVIVCLYAFTLLFSFGIGISADWTAPETYLSALFMLFFISSMLLFPVLISAVVLGLQKGRAKRVRDDSTFVPVQNIDYYRDNLSELNPSLVSLLIDLDLYGRKDIVAALLRMQNKKVIRFEENGRIVVTAENAQRLDSSELELLNSIKNNKLNDKKALLQWKQNRFCEAERLGYIQKKKTGNKVKIIGKYAGAAALSMVAALAIWGVFLGMDLYKNLDSVIGIILMFAALLAIDLLIFVPWYLLLQQVSYIGRFDILWERTQLGNETAEKIAGLARFIHEFSLLSQAKQEQVALWDDYLVYAIVLEENEQVIKEIGKRYKIDLHKLQINNGIWNTII